ncbi:MAG: M23 family metallopeptidase [Peptococcaceae bacterium]
MNKEKLSKFLDQYSDYLQKYGIYLLVVLFIFTFTLSYLLTSSKKETLEKTMAGPDAEVVIDSVGNGGTDKQEPASEKKEERIAPDRQNPVQNPAKVNEEHSLQEVPVVSNPPNEEPIPVKAAQEREAADDEEKNDSGAMVPASAHPLVFSRPVQGAVLNDYGLRYSEIYADYRLHPGIDIKTNPGDYVKAAAGGTVKLVENSEERKITIEIEHGNGWLTRYAHLAQALVQEGQRVKAGEEIGQAGMPGNEELASGSHLHFQIQQNRQWVNPADYLQELQK